MAEGQGQTCCLIICLLISIALPVAMIAMGALHVDDCPIERYIPIYLIVAGAFTVLKTILMVGCYLTNKDNPKKGIGLMFLINLFLFAWFIAGCYWIYHVHKEYQGDHPLLPKYCHRQLYLFAFWTQIIFCVLMLLEILGSICKLCRGD